MAFTEIKNRNNKKYYYRVSSFRRGDRILKKRIYMGVNLTKEEINRKEIQADGELGFEDRRKKDLREIIKKIIKILKKNNIKRAGIFGSYARGEQNSKSDIDILVEPAKPMGFAFVGIQFELEDKLKKKVDLITYNSIHPLLKERILNEEVKII